MIDEFNVPERTPDNAEMFAYYDRVMSSIQQMHRGMLIDRLGNVLWEEDYDAWQLRLKELADD